MNLILWRHAEAEDGADDMSRELTKKGRKQAQKAAAWLRQHLPDDTRILVSPAIRTRQTVAALTDQFTLLETLAPGASAHEVLEAIQWPGIDGTVLVVGHQPTLGAVAATLLDSRCESLSIKKGALWWLRCRSASGEAELRTVISPEFL